MSSAYITSVVVVILWFRVVCSTERYNIFIHQLQKELHPYQLTLLTSTFNQSNYFKNEFLENIINEVPVVNINPSEMTDNRSLSLGVHRNPRAARALTVILQDTLNFSELEKYFKLIAELAPIEPRPKCLLVLSDNGTSEDAYEALFEHAWSLNFLEFLILQLHGHGTSTCVDYNPFTNAVNRWTYEPNVKLFPNKLRNIHRHPIKIHPYEFWPLTTVTIDKASGNKKIIGLPYNYIRIFLEQTNGLEKHANLKGTDIVTATRQALDDGSLDMLIAPFMVGMYLHDKPMMKSKLFATEELLFVVPLLTESKLNFPPHVQMNFAYVVGLILCFKLAAKALKFSIKDWTTIEIAKLLLGVPASSKLWKNTPERMVALVVILLSMRFSSDLIAELTDIKLLKKELPLNDLDQINESSLPIDSVDYYYSYFKEKFSNLRNQVHKIRNTSECFQANVRGEHRICVASDIEAKYYVSVYREARVRIAEPPIFLDFKAFVFGKNSPYIEQFNDILTRLDESGIPKTWLGRTTTNKLELYEKLFSESNISAVLLVVTVSGFWLASLAFILELVWHSLEF